MRRILMVALATLLVGGLAPAWGQTGGGPEPDPAPTKDPEPDPGPSGRADMAVAYDGPATVLTGERAALTFTATNSGPDPADSASLVVSVPPGLDDVLVTTGDPATTCTWSPYAYGYGVPPEADGPAYRGDGGYADCQIGAMAPGVTFSMTLEMTRTLAREMYVNAWAGSYTGDENYENNYVDVFLDADKTHPADLGLTMDAPKSVAVGETFAITEAVSNDGPSDANNVRVKTDLVPGLDLVSVPDGCTYEEGGGPPPPGAGPDQPFWDPRSVVCVADGIAAGSSHAFGIQVQRVSGWDVWVSAWVEGANYDANYENDYAYVTLPADPSVTSDLSIKSAAPSSVLVGEEFDMTFTIGNAGPAGAGDVSMYDYLPPGLEFISTTEDSCRFDDYSYKEPAPYAGEPGAPGAPEGDGISPPIYYGGGFLVCDLGVVGSGDKRSFTARFRRTSAYEIWNYASVGASNFDPLYDNNYTELLLGPDKSVVADLSVAMNAPADPQVGETFDFDIAVTNDGPAVAHDVVLSDFLPEGLDFVSVAPDTCTFSDYPGGAAPAPGESPPYYGYREVRCDLGDIEPGASAPVTLRTTRTFEWEIWNGAAATTSSYDPNWENDYGYALIQGDNPYVDCSGVDGGKGEDSVVTDECPVDTGPGADDVSIEAGSGTETREVRTGAGRDDIHVALKTPSEGNRLIDVWSGGGADVITVTVAPGAGNAGVVVHSGGGDDRVFLDVAPRVQRLKIVVRSGDGNDSVTTVRYPGRTGRRGWLVVGGRGSDTIVGGNAADRLWGGAGRDSIDAGAGDDLLDGGHGRDRCLAGAGRDETHSC